MASIIDQGTFLGDQDAKVVGSERFNSRWFIDVFPEITPDNNAVERSYEAFLTTTRINNRSLMQNP